jgi:hypothetical protein
MKKRHALIAGLALAVLGATGASAASVIATMAIPMLIRMDIRTKTTTGTIATTGITIRTGVRAMAMTLGIGAITIGATAIATIAIATTAITMAGKGA